MKKEAQVGCNVLILVGPYEGETATVIRMDRRKGILAKVNRGPDAGEETRVVKGNYKVI